MKADDDSFQSINKLLSEAKLLLPLVNPNLGNEIKEHIAKTQDMVSTSIAFNEYFSDLGWCAYNTMPLTLIKAAVDAFEKAIDGDPYEAGQAVLVEYYTTTAKNMVPKARKRSRYFRVREDQIVNAFEAHFAGNYILSVPLFLMIIDGSVNDYTKGHGFFSEQVDLSVWDRLEGADDGLKKMQKLFSKTRQRTNNEEIRIPYRNGIFHGTDLNYANKYVSCKCVSLLFAVGDWMAGKSDEEERKKAFAESQKPVEWTEILLKDQKIKMDKQMIHAWQENRREIDASQLFVEQPTIKECTDYPYLIPLIKFLEAWKIQNYGEMAKQLIEPSSKETKNHLAGNCRSEYQERKLEKYTITGITEKAVNITEAIVTAEWIYPLTS